MKLTRNITRSDKNAARLNRKTKRVATWCKTCMRKHSKDDPCDFRKKTA